MKPYLVTTMSGRRFVVFEREFPLYDAIRVPQGEEVATVTRLGVMIKS